jgi:hypothetical protein
VGKRPLNGDIKKKMKILALIVFLAFVIIVLWNIGKDRDGCTGSCEQGRRPCDCKDNND